MFKNINDKAVTLTVKLLADWGSAMMIILAGTKPEHLNMLEGGIIAKLLEEKWTTFAQVGVRRMFDPDSIAIPVIVSL